jgi:hypothetical protein
MIDQIFSTTAATSKSENVTKSREGSRRAHKPSAVLFPMYRRDDEER